MDLNQIISESISKVLNQQLIVRPIFCKKNTLAKMLDRTPEDISNLIKEQVLVEGVHIIRPTPKSHAWFYVPQILADLMPPRATVQPGYVFCEETEQDK